MSDLFSFSDANLPFVASFERKKKTFAPRNEAGSSLNTTADRPRFESLAFGLTLSRNFDLT